MKTTFDKDLLMCVFLFLLLLAVYLATGDPKIETIMQNFGGAVIMGLKVSIVGKEQSPLPQEKAE